MSSLQEKTPRRWIAVHGSRKEKRWESAGRGRDSGWCQCVIVRAEEQRKEDKTWVGGDVNPEGQYSEKNAKRQPGSKRETMRA